MTDKTFRLTRNIQEPVPVENEATQYRRVVEIIHTGKTWAEAKTLRQADRSLSIEQER